MEVGVSFDYSFVIRNEGWDIGFGFGKEVIGGGEREVVS